MAWELPPLRSHLPRTRGRRPLDRRGRPARIGDRTDRGTVLISYLAVRRVKMPIWQRVVLAAEAVLGIAVITLELLAQLTPVDVRRPGQESNLQSAR